MRLPPVLTRAVARTKPAVPEGAWPLLLALRSLAGRAAIVGEPALRAVVVLAAHPDDESLGCAGTLALLRRRGVPITVAFATDGEATMGSPVDAIETARRRRAEALGACAGLGIADVRFWGFPDGGLATRIPQLSARIGDVLRGGHGLMLPWFFDGHPDHEALSTALAAATVSPDVEVWAYEIGTPLPANRIVDITSVWGQKEAAIAAHDTANLAFDLDAALGLNRWRSMNGLMGRGWAEAFLAAPVADYLAVRARALGGGVAGG